ncbi:MAG: hypothetical protein O2887_08565 [Bacteroidetes bacterium]|nr:hypothetical protein [Bacteroidota bacterium]MDA1120531.1 hypothetical protein [Bacteroidota bacterium]
MLNKIIISLAISLGSCAVPDKVTKETVKEVTSQSYVYEGEQLRVGVIGLVHDHVGWILGREKVGDIEIVGIVEPNLELANRYCKKYGYPIGMVYSTLEEMVGAVQPEAVTAFNMIYDHL